MLTFLLGMSLLDSLNPFTIAIHIFLLGNLKNTNRIIFYVLGISVVYFVGGIVLFSGLTTVFAKLADLLATIPELIFYILESIFGVILVVYGFIEFRKWSEPRQLPEDKEVATWALISLGAGGTLSDLPTSIPYLAFIAKMTEMRIDIWLGCSLLLIYNVIYILPLLIIWVFYLSYKDNIRNRMESVTLQIEKTSKYITLIFCEIIGVICIIESIFYYYINFPDLIFVGVNFNSAPTPQKHLADFFYFCFWDTLGGGFC